MPHHSPSLYDAHCHLSPNCFSIDPALLGPRFTKASAPQGSIAQIALMSTNHYDCRLVVDLANYGTSTGQNQIVPCLGIHPWYSHLFTLLDQNQDEPDQDFKLRHYQSVFKKDDLDLDFLNNLPHPTNLNSHLQQLQLHINDLRKSHQVFLIGEIGLDKLFRVPWAGFLGNQSASNTEKLASEKSNNNSQLSPFRVSMDHQTQIFTKQLELAWANNLPVSVHSVKCHGLLYDIFTDFFKQSATIKASNDKNSDASGGGDSSSSSSSSSGGNIKRIPAICLHSYTGSIEQAKVWATKLKQVLKNTHVYFSFSSIINSNNGKTKQSFDFKTLIQSLPDSLILIETDLPIDHYYAEKSNETHYNDLMHIAKLVCDIKNWKFDKGVQTLNENWQRFKIGQ